MSTIAMSEILVLLNEAGIEKNVEELEPSTSLLDQGLDSLDMMNIYFQIEEKFGISIGEESIGRGEWNTLNSILESIKKSLPQD